jgi:hypothetical protein
MPIVLTKSMKKNLEQVLQKSVEINHVGSLERLELTNIDMEEVMTFHS